MHMVYSGGVDTTINMSKFLIKLPANSRAAKENHIKLNNNATVFVRLIHLSFIIMSIYIHIPTLFGAWRSLPTYTNTSINMVRQWKEATTVGGDGDGISYSCLMLVLWVGLLTLSIVSAIIFSCAQGMSKENKSAEVDETLYGGGCGAGCGAACGG